MNNTITITLYKPLIMESVKNETFLKGRYDKAVNEKLNAAAYEEQAGDDAYHERILKRTLATSLEELKTHLTDYLPDTAQSSADNITSEEGEDNIILHITVSTRFNKAYTTSLARLCAKYIEEAMLMDWWRPINEKQSLLYANFVERDLAAIKRCFNKTAPDAPSYKYTTALTVLGSAIELAVGEQHTITYSLSDGAIDDIEIRLADTHICQAARSTQGFSVVAKQRGHTYAVLYSRHNDEISKTIHIYVTDHF